MPTTATNTRLLATRENEWDTEEIVQLKDQLFHRVINGGSSGSRNRQRGDGSWASGALSCEAITPTEAARLLLLWGWEPENVTEVLDHA